ncbi:MAG: hypothetical protein M1825_005253 [Sarcosagium campestre]|nr:MAG: hypothetical protein M1825_005253 [Sarcosagium campestre]
MSAPLKDICPVCKSSRYLNPNMRFLINPECYHKMCESCVDRIFSHGPAPCPVAGCHRTLRKQRFRKQTFGDIHVEKEVDVRRRVAKTFNQRADDFETLQDYNNYLEEVETLTFNLLNNIDVAETEAKLAAHAAQNADNISRNDEMLARESASAEARQAQERDEARQRREYARLQDELERKDRDDTKKELLDRLTSAAGADADKIAREARRLAQQRTSERRRAVPMNGTKVVVSQDGPVLASDEASTVAGGTPPRPFVIKGLKRADPRRRQQQQQPEREYDPFGGLSDRREYSVLRHHYNHPWLDRARTDPSITAGGYDVREYETRALVEAFSGLGVFIEDKVDGQQAGVTAY